MATLAFSFLLAFSLALMAFSLALMAFTLALMLPFAFAFSFLGTLGGFGL